ncbi:MAG: MFS transporter [Candidatus Kapaibacterium sp.]
MTEEELLPLSELDGLGVANTKKSSGKTSATCKFEALHDRVEKRNFTLGVSNGVLYNLGTYFISRSTIIPSFLATITASSALIGIVSQFESIGWYLPQLFAAAFVVHRSRKMPMYRLSVVLRGLAFFGMAATAFFCRDHKLLLVVFILTYGLFTFSSGIGGVVFTELLAKAIPHRRRGRFLGLRLSFGALLSATLGATTITLLLSAAPFPLNFAHIFLVGAVITTTGLVFMALMREPRTDNLPEKRRMSGQLKMGLTILQQDKRFATFVTARMLLGSWTIGVPFLILFAQSHLGFRTGDLGIFITAECVGLIISNFFWERIADRRNTKLVLLITASLAIALPLCLLAFQAFTLPPILFTVIFATSAAIDAGMTIGGLGYLIEIAPEDERATYIGVHNSLLALPSLLTALAGLLLDWAGFTTLYLVVLAIGVCALLAVRRLEYIRHTVVS